MDKSSEHMRVTDRVMSMGYLQNVPTQVEWDVLFLKLNSHHFLKERC